MCSDVAFECRRHVTVPSQPLFPSVNFFSRKKVNLLMNLNGDKIECIYWNGELARFYVFLTKYIFSIYFENVQVCAWQLLPCHLYNCHLSRYFIDIFVQKNGTIRLESSSQFLGLIESYLSFKKEEIAPGMAAEGEQVLFRDFWIETFLKRLLQEFMQVSTWHWKELLLSRIKYTYYYHVRVWHMGVYTYASQK